MKHFGIVAADALVTNLLAVVVPVPIREGLLMLPDY
jgi:hypothetical protein